MYLTIAEEKTFTCEETIFLITYCLLLALSVVIYRKWKKKYLSIPDKMVVAHLKKDYFLSGEPNDSDAAYRIPNYVGVYEYEIDGKKYRKKISLSSYRDTIILYYKKGKKDVRTASGNPLPQIYILFWGVYFIIGLLAISFVLTKCICGTLSFLIS